MHQCQEKRDNRSLHQKVDSGEIMPPGNVSFSLVTNTDDKNQKRCPHKEQTIYVKVFFQLERTMSVLNRGTNRELEFKTKYKGNISHTSYPQSWEEDRCSLFHQCFSVCYKYNLLIYILKLNWFDSLVNINM